MSANAGGVPEQKVLCTHVGNVAGKGAVPPAKKIRLVLPFILIQWGKVERTYAGNVKCVVGSRGVLGEIHSRCASILIGFSYGDQIRLGIICDSSVRVHPHRNEAMKVICRLVSYGYAAGKS